MAVNPQSASTMAMRYIPNPATPPFLKITSPQDYLLTSLETILTFCPPSLPFKGEWRNQTYRGLFIGPSSVAYLFFQLSLDQPSLIIQEKTAAEWCKLYLCLGQENAAFNYQVSCGITDEFLVWNSLMACFTKDISHVHKVVAALSDPEIQIDATWSEWMKGRAGAIYLLRLMRHHVPDCTTIIGPLIQDLIKHIIANQPWIWGGRYYCGPVHGDFGILTQIILADPSYAGELEPKLIELLDLQEENGNWPVIPGKDIGLVQFCHGAPGAVISLVAIREHFPNLEEKIDSAITKARKLTWERGLLVKEPNICHGIIGNALALEGDEKEHFLAYCTPEMMKGEGIEGLEGGWDKGGEMEEKWSMLWGEAGRAWIWMEIVSGRKDRFAMYTDI